jgi:hypothetical protein
VTKRVRVVELPGLPPKGDVSDWVASGGNLAQLEALVAATAPYRSETIGGGQRAGSHNPTPDIDAPPVRDFPVMAEEAFVGLAGEIVRMIEPHTESDRAGLLLSAHAFFGNCIGRGPHYRVESTEHGLNLFVLKTGDSSKARKGTGEDEFVRNFVTSTRNGHRVVCIPACRAARV